MGRNPQDLLYHSNLLVDIFGFLLLAMPQFRFNDASVETGASEGIFSFQAIGGQWRCCSAMDSQPSPVRKQATLKGLDEDS